MQEYSMTRVRSGCYLVCTLLMSVLSCSLFTFHCSSVFMYLCMFSLCVLPLVMMTPYGFFVYVLSMVFVDYVVCVSVFTKVYCPFCLLLPVWGWA